MNKYEVIVPINLYGSVYLTIEAESEEEAKTKAQVKASFTPRGMITYHNCRILKPRVFIIESQTKTDIED